jgi:DNA-binding transcriptional MerR regulator
MVRRTIQACSRARPRAEVTTAGRKRPQRVSVKGDKAETSLGSEGPAARATAAERLDSILGYRVHSEVMKIGELAKKAGVNIQTIRYYERERILREPKRTASGYRAFTDQDLQRVVFIKVCQNIGFTLNEIRQLSGLHDLLGNASGNKKALEEICQMAAQRLHLLDEKIEALQTMRRNLLDFLRQPAECPSQKNLTS